MPIGPARMPLMDHIGELRRRIVIIVVALAVTVCFMYLLAPYLIDFLILPVSDYVTDVYVTGAFEGFSLKFRVALIFWELLAFFLPALRPNERRYVLPTFFVAVALYVLGMVFCYCFCLNPAFQFLTTESMSIGQILPQATDYLHYIILFELAFGLAFELPLVVFFLILFNIVPYKKMRASWRGIYVGLLVVAAIVTPDASPVTMGIMFAALLALYEVSLAAARIALACRGRSGDGRVMHELSLVQGIFDSVIPVARQNGATKITGIKLTIGEMTMVVPEAMEFAFEALSEDDPLLDGCVLEMDFVAPKSRCLDCGNEFEHDRFHSHCPACDSAATVLIAGRELDIASMEIETPDDEDSPA